MKQIIVLAALLIAVSLAMPQGGGGGDSHHGSGSGIGGIGTPVDVKHEKEIHFKAHPEFKYDYEVHDDKHHDYKKKQEHRDGYKVEGSYGLLQPDGHWRQVDYKSDKKEGWTAKVTYTKHH